MKKLNLESECVTFQSSHSAFLLLWFFHYEYIYPQKYTMKTCPEIQRKCGRSPTGCTCHDRVEETYFCTFIPTKGVPHLHPFILKLCFSSWWWRPLPSIFLHSAPWEDCAGHLLAQVSCFSLQWLMGNTCPVDSLLRASDWIYHCSSLTITRKM